VQALQEAGRSLSDFSIDERMSWAKGRITKRPEDAAYSLLGLFGVHMPPIYGEGRERAFRRLRREIELETVILPLEETSYRFPGPLAVKRQEEREGDSANFIPPLSPSVSELSDMQIPLSKEFEPKEPSQHRASTQGLVVSSTDNMVQGKNEEVKQRRNEAVAVNTETTGPYEKVAVLLVRWADELDDLETSQDVSGLCPGIYVVATEQFHNEH
jgi:hypothetical protein